MHWTARLWLSCLVCVVFASLSVARSAWAGSPLSVDAVPVLGERGPAVDGWGELSIRLENGSIAPVVGFVELREVTRRSAPRVLSRAPFAVAAKSRVHLLLPSHGLSRSGDARVVAVDTRGEDLFETTVPPLRELSPLLFDLNSTSRIAPVLNGQALAIRSRGMGYGYGATTLAVTTPQINVTTGDAVLPDLAAGYASATVVLASGRELSNLPPPTLDALVSWVLAGGALAIVLDRPEDLRSPWLEALAGGHVQSAPAPRALSAVTQFAVPADSARFGRGKPRIVLESAKPSAELANTLFGVSGANLRPTPWGESASYGLGEVHLLAFNPNTELGAGDPWLRLELLDLVRHAWERASSVALPHGQSPTDDPRAFNVRRVLDPNEATRWTVVISTLLLLIYAALAGPLNFFLAQRAGRPLRALVYLPVWSALAMASIVLLGILGKGVSGRARHLTLIEAGAGMARASITRFRGLYGSRADDVTVRAARGSVLDVLGAADEVSRDLIIDRDGLRLERLREKPWEIQVVREDGFTNLGAGVSLIAGEGGELTIKNRCARDLLSVLVNAPGKGLFYFPKLADGQAVSLKQGRGLGSVGVASPLGTHVLSVASFHDTLEEHAKGVGAAWEALESVTGSDADWWPDDVPVLIGELEGGEGRGTDSGLRLDVDRVLVRVVGYGGVP